MNFLKALIIFIRMYRDGFFFSNSPHKDPDGTRWGFYRFNHICQASMFDIDYSFDGKTHNYFHLNGDEYRATFDTDGRFLKILKTIKKSECEARIWWLG